MDNYLVDDSSFSRSSRARSSSSTSNNSSASSSSSASNASIVSNANNVSFPLYRCAHKRTETSPNVFPYIGLDECKDVFNYERNIRFDDQDFTKLFSKFAFDRALCVHFLNEKKFSKNDQYLYLYHLIIAKDFDLFRHMIKKGVKRTFFNRDKLNISPNPYLVDYLDKFLVNKHKAGIPISGSNNRWNRYNAMAIFKKEVNRPTDVFLYASIFYKADEITDFLLNHNRYANIVWLIATQISVLTGNLFALEKLYEYKRMVINTKEIKEFPSYYYIATNSLMPQNLPLSHWRTQVKGNRSDSHGYGFKEIYVEVKNTLDLAENMFDSNMIKNTRLSNTLSRWDEWQEYFNFINKAKFFGHRHLISFLISISKDASHPEKWLYGAASYGDELLVNYFLSQYDFDLKVLEKAQSLLYTQYPREPSECKNHLSKFNLDRDSKLRVLELIVYPVAARSIHNSTVHKNQLKIAYALYCELEDHAFNDKFIADFTSQLVETNLDSYAIALMNKHSFSQRDINNLFVSLFNYFGKISSYGAKREELLQKILSLGPTNDNFDIHPDLLSKHGVFFKAAVSGELIYKNPKNMLGIPVLIPTSNAVIAKANTKSNNRKRYV